MSFYANTNSSFHNSYLKIGSMDEEAYTGDLSVIATVNSSTWALNIDKMTVGIQEMDFEATTLLHIDPSIPYMYLPVQYWSLFSLYVESRY